MVSTTRKIMHIFLGLILLILGLAGLVLPILNGTVLLIVGFILISFESPYVERKLFQITQKNRVVHSIYIKMDSILRKIFRK